MGGQVCYGRYGNLEVRFAVILKMLYAVLRRTPISVSHHIEGLKIIWRQPESLGHKNFH